MSNAETTPEQAAQPIECPTCGRVLSPRAVTCPGCGTPTDGFWQSMGRTSVFHRLRPGMDEQAPTYVNLVEQEPEPEPQSTAEADTPEAPDTAKGSDTPSESGADENAEASSESETSEEPTKSESE